MRSVLTTLALLMFAAPLTLAQDAAIINAVRWADYAELQRLLADGADPNAQDEEGSWSALILAASSGNARIVELLLAEGADPNLPTSWGAPPLLWATSNEHADVVALLLAAGATTNLQDAFGYTSFYASRGKRLSRHPRAAPSPPAADPNLQDLRGKSALHWAAEKGRANTVEWLLTIGADLDLRANDGANRCRTGARTRASGHCPANRAGDTTDIYWKRRPHTGRSR